ncbi:tyrosine-type recombinase/integrase [Bacillus dakarensis]|uniref:tyrosine-type recombinase/integrase n=1 Tax=Robertmurraya dakarensis TaxID=1926278 RepID=UPI003B01F2E7
MTDRIGTHSLRKTFGYFAYQQGIDLAMIQKLLNHSSQAETLRYIGITQEQMDEVVLRLDL